MGFKVRLAVGFQCLCHHNRAKIGTTDADVYYVCDFPSDMYWSDVIKISIVAFLLCLVATIYPAWRAASTHPAETLRYE